MGNKKNTVVTKCENYEVKCCIVDESVFGDYDPDSAPYTWDNVYMPHIKNSTWKYWKIFKLYDWEYCKQKDKETGEYYIRQKAGLDQTFLSDDYDIDYEVFKTSWFETLSMAGDTCFNFKPEGKTYYKLNEIIEGIVDTNTKSTLQLRLKNCSARHHCLRNFGLMLVTGRMNNFKGQGPKDLDQFDKFIYELDKAIRFLNEDRNKAFIDNIKWSMLYENEKDYACNEKLNEAIVYYITDLLLLNEDVRLLNYATKQNRPALIIFLSLFKNIYEYCKVMYGITDENLVCALIKSGEQEINSAERVKQYLNLANRFWEQRGINRNKCGLNKEQCSLECLKNDESANVK